MIVISVLSRMPLEMDAVHQMADEGFSDDCFETKNKGEKRKKCNFSTKSEWGDFHILVLIDRV